MQPATVVVLFLVSSVWRAHSEEVGVNAASTSHNCGSDKSDLTDFLEELATSQTAQVLLVLAATMGFSKYRHASRRKSRKKTNMRVRTLELDRSIRCNKQVGGSSTVGVAHGKQQETSRLAEFLKDAAKAKDITEFTKLLNEVEKGDDVLTRTDYGLAVAHLAKEGHAVTAYRWLRRAIELESVPHRVAFGALIHSYAQQGDITQVLAVVGDMQDAGLELDTVIYNMVIGAWGRAGNAEASQLWMKKMLEVGLSPSVVSFGTIFKVCAEAGLVEELDWWLTQAHNFDIKLNLVCFGAVVKAFASREQVAQAMTWIARMTECGVQPDIQCFMWVLKPILKAGDLDRAANLIECMRGAGVQPDAGVFGQCIMAACAVGNRRRALDWAEECVASKCRLTHAVENAMVQARLRIPKVRRNRQMDTYESAGPDHEWQDEDAANRGTFQKRPEEQNQEDRIACVGRRFKGVVKCVVTEKYGFIQCDETYRVFTRDVFLCSKDFPVLVSVGLPVSFILRIDYRAGTPRASDVKLEPPSPPADAVDN